MDIRHLSPSELDLVAPDSWPLRRRDYERWLAEPGSFALVAEDGEEVVGYAVVHVGGPRRDLGEPSSAPRASGPGAGRATADVRRVALASRWRDVHDIRDLHVGASESVGARTKDFPAPDARTA